MASPTTLAGESAARQTSEFGRQLHSFCNYDDGEMLSVALARPHEIANVLNRERNFGDKNNVRAAGDSGLNRDPARVTSHDFNHHDPMVRLGGGVDLVNGVTRGVQR